MAFPGEYFVCALDGTTGIRLHARWNRSRVFFCTVDAATPIMRRIMTSSFLLTTAQHCQGAQQRGPPAMCSQERLARSFGDTHSQYKEGGDTPELPACVKTAARRQKGLANGFAADLVTLAHTGNTCTPACVFCPQQTGGKHAACRCILPSRPDRHCSRLQMLPPTCETSLGYMCSTVEVN